MDVGSWAKGETVRGSCARREFAGMEHVSIMI